MTWGGGGVSSLKIFYGLEYLFIKSSCKNKKSKTQNFFVVIFGKNLYIRALIPLKSDGVSHIWIIWHDLRITIYCLFTVIVNWLIPTHLLPTSIISIIVFSLIAGTIFKENIDQGLSCHGGRTNKLVDVKSKFQACLLLMLSWSFCYSMILHSFPFHYFRL